MTDDAELLRRYDRNNSEEAFTELVRRHLDFVYATALRRLGGDAHQAADVAQTVFVKLARHAGPLSARPVLAGWLHTATRNAAIDVIRSETRRRTREHDAMELKPDPAPAEEWEQLRPVLDAALDSLTDADREAVLLRFFEGRRFGDIGTLLGLSEDNARRRVDRALEKLRAGLARRGLTSTSAALATVLTTQAAVAAPAGLATAVTSAALATGGTAVAAASFMSLTKMQLGIAGAVVLAGGGLVFHQERTNAQLRAELAALPLAKVAADIERLRDKNADMTRAATRAQALEVSEAEWTQLRAQAAVVQDQLEQDARQARQAAAEARQRGASPAIPISQLDVQPRGLIRAVPVYPYELSQAKIGGSVLVEFVIDSEGAVQDARVVRSTHTEFEAPTLAAVTQWKFAPGKVRGRTVNTRVTQVLEYDPTGQAAAAPAKWF